MLFRSTRGAAGEICMRKYTLFADGVASCRTNCPPHQHWCGAPLPPIVFGVVFGGRVPLVRMWGESSRSQKGSNTARLRRQYCRPPLRRRTLWWSGTLLGRRGRTPRPSLSAPRVLRHCHVSRPAPRHCQSHVIVMRTLRRM